jgi:predicted nucleic acid-binding protein
LLAGKRQVNTVALLQFATESPLTAYDLEFVTLALSLGVPLVTFDKLVLAAFPSVAVAPAAFAEGGAAPG